MGRLGVRVGALLVRGVGRGGSPADGLAAGAALAQPRCLLLSPPGALQAWREAPGSPTLTSAAPLLLHA